MIDLTIQSAPSYLPAPQAFSRKRGFTETLSPLESNPLTQKTGEIAIQWLKVPSKKRKNSTPLVLAKRQILTRIGNIGVNFECQVLGFLEFIRSSKGGSLPKKKLSDFCENILSYADWEFISKFPFKRIEWSSVFFTLLAETFEDLLIFLEKHEKRNPSGKISYQTLLDADFDLHELCDAIEIHKKEPLPNPKGDDEEESEAEFDLAQPLQILLTDPLGQEVVLSRTNEGRN